MLLSSIQEVLMGTHFSPVVCTVGACGWFARQRSISVMSSARVVFLSGNRQACPTLGCPGLPGVREVCTGDRTPHQWACSALSISS